MHYLQNRPTLAVFGKSIQTAEFMAEMFSDIFENAVNISAYSYSDTLVTDATLVVTTHKSHQERAQQTFPQSTVFSPEKILTGCNLEKVMLLPKGTKVLVISQPNIAILETINHLIDMGLNHLEYIPYDPTQPVPANCDTAISPGLMFLCPEEITNRIDVGFRTVTTDSFNKILLFLGLGSHYLDKFSAQYKLPIMQGSNKLAKNIEKIGILNQERDFIINKIPDGVISVSEDKEILYLNNVMEGILGRPKSSLIGEKIYRIIAKVSNVTDLLRDLAEEINVKITVNGTKFVYNCLVMQHGDQRTYLYTFKKSYNVALLEEKAQIEAVKRGYTAKYDFSDIWGSNTSVLEMKEQAQTFAKNNVTILIVGESGTGKELLAQAIHNNSLRQKGPFVPINFAALPESLLESELFGYEDGAFTGAKKGGKAGCFEMANGGTIFIDEIGEMPYSLQARLLRVLQEREITRLGGNSVIPIDVRIIAATNRDLQKEVSENRFRADLYYRLNILSVTTVPLREFKEETELLIRTYLSTKYNYHIESIDEEAKAIFEAYNWPGNMRELINVSDYIFYSSAGKYTVSAKVLPQYIKDRINSLRKVAVTMPVMEAATQEKPVLDAKLVILAILQILNANRNKKNGREFLIKELKAAGYEVTAHYLKTYITQMRQQGLIEVGSTKQGTAISQAGFEYLLEFQ